MLKRVNVNGDLTAVRKQQEMQSTYLASRERSIAFLRRRWRVCCLFSVLRAKVALLPDESTTSGYLLLIDVC